ncbi:type II toxin-antitoxin system Phd/YefM family antitoxin [Candidatus Latescibacterota bacterium]
MAIQTTYSKARANLAKLCNQASENKEIVLISRRKAEDVALISTSELSGLLETAHLMRSPKNAQRLLTALNRALSETENAQSFEDLKRDLGFGEEE